MDVSRREISRREAEGASASCASCKHTLARQSSPACISQLAAVLLWLWDRQEKIEHALGDFHDEPRPVFTSDTTLEHEPISANIDFFKNNPFIGKEDSAMVSDLVNSFLNDELSYSHDEKMKVARVSLLPHQMRVLQFATCS